MAWLCAASAFAAAFLTVFFASRPPVPPVLKKNPSVISKNKDVSPPKADAKTTVRPTSDAPLRSPEEPTLVVASSRPVEPLFPLFHAFTERTGIKVSAFMADIAELEGDAPADVMLADRLAPLALAKKEGKLALISSPALVKNVPSGLRDPDGAWYAAGVFARAIFFPPESFDKKKNAPDSYDDVTDKRFQGKLLLVAGDEAGGASMLADAMATLGEKKAASWWQKIRKNVAPYSPEDGAALLRALASGKGAAGLADSRDYVKLAFSGYAKDRAVVEGLAMRTPSSKEGGAWIDAAAAAVLKKSLRPGNAKAFIEFLTSEEGQKLYGYAYGEFSVQSDAASVPPLSRGEKLFYDPSLPAAAAPFIPKARHVLDGR